MSIGKAMPFVILSYGYPSLFLSGEATLLYSYVGLSADVFKARKYHVCIIKAINIFSKILKDQIKWRKLSSLKFIYYLGWAT